MGLQFPKSLAEFKTLIGYNRGNTPRDIDFNKQASPQEMMQGTRAASYMGHWSDPSGYDDEVWTPPITQFDYGDGPQIANTQTNKTTWPWPPNPALNEISPPGTRDEQIRTDFELQTGEAPGRILRQLYMRVQGNNGNVFGTNVGTVEMPYMTSWQYMEHLKVPRKALGTKGPQKLADDNLPVPAIFAGNPRP